MREYPGYLFTLEGMDRVGKSTHAKLLKIHLEGKGYRVEVYREPGTTPMGEAIRQIVKDAEIPRTNLASCLLFEAARADFTEKVVIPSLRQRKIVICDRFYDSTTVYQGIVGGLEIRTVGVLNHIASHHLSPDRTFLIDAELDDIQIPAEQLLDQKDYFEKQPREYRERLKKGFQEIARREPHRIKIIPYKSRDIDGMQKLMRDEVERVLAA